MAENETGPKIVSSGKLGQIEKVTSYRENWYSKTVDNVLACRRIVVLMQRSCSLTTDDNCGARGMNIYE
jgi:hypothetical protein